MKKICCFLVLFCVLFSACSRQTQAQTQTQYTTLDGDIVDASYDAVAKVKDFKCDVSFRERQFTIEGEKAKEIYKLLSDNLSQEKRVASAPDVESIDILFYSGEKIDRSPYALVDGGTIYGIYHVSRDMVWFSPSPVVSVAYFYETEPTLFEQVCALTGVNEG